MFVNSNPIWAIQKTLDLKGIQNLEKKGAKSWKGIFLKKRKGLNNVTYHK
jgi:hypothetical protein